MSHETCPICFEKLNKTNVSVTICNHKFCTSCLLSSIINNNNCPICRKELIKKKRQTMTSQPILVEDLVDLFN